jgi:ParB family chromosome partitioning protein
MATVTYEKGKLYDLPIIDLKPDPNQPRKSIDPQALEELVASIQTHGIIQPLLFRVDAESPYLILVAGERRFKAAQLAGLLTVPGIFVEGNPSEIALVENLLRQDLTAIEEAEALQRLKEQQQYTDEQLSGVIGKARTTISDIMLINRLPLEIRDECRGDQKISKNVLIEIARKKQVRGMQTAYEKYKEKVKKVAEGRMKQAKEPETAADATAWLSKTVNKLNGLDASAWTEDEKNTFNQNLLNLQETIQALLNPPALSNLA